MKTIKSLLLYLLIILCVAGGINYLARKSAEAMHESVMQEIRAFHEFKNDPQNKGQYIMDFDTEIWYDIDGLNPDVLPLTINEMSIKNIRERIMKRKKSSSEIVFDRIGEFIFRWGAKTGAWKKEVL